MSSDPLASSQSTAKSKAAPLQRKVLGPCCRIDGRKMPSSPACRCAVAGTTQVPVSSGIPLRRRHHTAITKEYAGVAGFTTSEV